MIVGTGEVNINQGWTGAWPQDVVVDQVDARGFGREVEADLPASCACDRRREGEKA